MSTSNIKTEGTYHVEVGDKLRAIAETGAGHELLSHGEIVTVVVVKDDWRELEHRMLWVEKESGKRYSACAFRFAPLDILDRLMETDDILDDDSPHKDFDWKAHGTNRLGLKVGDKAFSNGQSSHLTKGKVVTILVDGGHYAQVEDDEGNGSDVWWGDLFEVKVETFGPVFEVGQRVEALDTDISNDYLPGTVIGFWSTQGQQAYTDGEDNDSIRVKLDYPGYSVGAFDRSAVRPLVEEPESEIFADAWEILDEEREVVVESELTQDDLRAGDRVVSIADGDEGFITGLVEIVEPVMPYTRYIQVKSLEGDEKDGDLLIFTELDLDTLHEAEEPAPDLKPGDRVRVREGHDKSYLTTGNVHVVSELPIDSILKQQWVYLDEGNTANYGFSAYVADLELVPEGEILVGDRVVYTGEYEGYSDELAIGSTGTVTYIREETYDVEWDITERTPAANVYKANVRPYKQETLPQGPDGVPIVDSLAGLAAVSGEGTVLRSPRTNEVYVRVDGHWKGVGSTGDHTWTIVQTISVGQGYEVLFLG